ncbi:hypothetical protein, partial [Gemmiger formicilis]|uniref:hypothetical protein n=1 Tax=Gemmiger formicilis TaxID=745368 RepID=UPI00195DAB39
LFLLCKEGTEETLIKKAWSLDHAFLYIIFHYGGSGTPESTVENRKNRWKNSLSRRFSRFFRFDFSFGGLGGE